MHQNNEPQVGQPNGSPVNQEKGCWISIKENCLIFVADQIKYDSSILNKSGLLQQLSKSTGLSLSEVLNNSTSLMEAGYTLCLKIWMFSS